MKRYVAIDLETTGHSPESSDKIIEIGLVVIENNEIVDEYSTLFNPEREIPPFISNLTGIMDEDVINAPLFAEKAQDIVDIFNNSYLVAHNVPFDLGFLNKQLTNIGLNELTNPIIDTVEFARILLPQSPGFKLSQLADYLNIQHNEPHRALSDAYVTSKLLLKLKDKLNSLPYETIHHLLKIEKKLNSDLHSLLFEQQQKLMMSKSENEKYTVFNGLAFKKISEPNKDKTKVTMSYGNFLDIIYEENGLLEEHIEGYEQRSGQREMSENIYDSFQAEKHALIEAGTGTGKSLAYLIPSIYEAVSTNRRIVISTHTIQLQSQLLEEEIPLVEKVIPFAFRVALLKGKSHYISLEKFEKTLHSTAEDNYDITLTKAKLLVWITETETGDIDEVQLPSSGYYFFKGISAASKEQVDYYSPWFTYSYYEHARKKAQYSDLIVTNHALLCTDLFNDYKLLPTYDKIIVDEAHHLEETASRLHGIQLNYANMQYKLNMLGTSHGTSWIHSTLTTYPDIKDIGIVNKWNDYFDNVKYEIDDLFDMLYRHVLAQKNQKSKSDIGKIQFRFKNDHENQSWLTIKDMVSRLILYLNKLVSILRNIEDYLTHHNGPTTFIQDDLIAHMKVLQSFKEDLNTIFINDNALNLVNWIEVDVRGSKNDIFLYSEPVEVSKLLTEDFFNNKKSVILTSATLTMRSSFSFMKNRLGLESENVFTNKIESPYAFEDQVQLMVPNDFPDITKDLDEYIFSTCEAIISLAEITKGRMLVLFTSYDMLKKSYHILREAIHPSDYILIAQGISSGSRTRLKKNFQTFDRAILLGTSSFWEGVDIPGEDLSSLVIARLPFQPPNHPIYEAKSALLEKEGKNVFFDYALPNAVIRFKQGFGRLIRSTNDRGVIFVCDSRIINARYGSFFTGSIPNVPIMSDSISSLIKKAETWF